MLSAHVVFCGHNCILVLYEGRLVVRNCFYGTSQSRNGVLCLLSCMTVNKGGAMSVCMQYVSPLVSEEEAESVVDCILYLLRNVE